MKKNKIDLDAEELEVFGKMWGIDNETRYTFFYDESNNIRKFWLNDKKNGFNANQNEDFVLAGVAYKERRPLISFDNVRSKLRLQPNVDEIKFKKQFSKNTFWECMEKKRLYTLLKYMEENGLYIHYLHVNNLYYTLVELFDSITTPEELEEFGFDYFKMKSLFYEVFKDKENELQQIMLEFKYPNLKKEEISAFTKAICGLFPVAYQMSIEQKFFYHCLERAGKNKSLIFLENNKDYVLQEDYSEFYIDAIRNFSNSTHYFDQEDEIKKKFENIEFVKDGESADIYSFIDSKMDILIQMSDVIAGVYGKLFTYVNESSSGKIRKDIGMLTDQQIKCVNQLGKLRKKANEENVGFLHSIAPLGEIRKVDELFEIVGRLSLK